MSVCLQSTEWVMCRKLTMCHQSPNNLYSVLNIQPALVYGYLWFQIVFFYYCFFYLHLITWKWYYKGFHCMSSLLQPHPLISLTTLTCLLQPITYFLPPLTLVYIPTPSTHLLSDCQSSRVSRVSLVGVLCSFPFGRLSTNLLCPWSASLSPVPVIQFALSWLSSCPLPQTPCLPFVLVLIYSPPWQPI